MCILNEVHSVEFARLILHFTGSENANQFLLAICELLVSMNLGIEEILLTRLPVGHTHEGTSPSAYLVTY